MNDRPLALSLQRGTVLIIDDDFLIHHALLRLFSKLPVEVVCASSVESSEAALDGRAPNVIVLDLLLPGGINGLDAIEPLKTRYPDASVVLFTAHRDRDVDRAAFRKGACDVLEKASDHDLLFFVVCFELGRVGIDGRRVPLNRAYVKVCTALALRDSASRVLRGILDEREEKEMAAEYGLALKTVQYHIQRLKQLTGARNCGGIIKRVLLS